ncbi:MAG: peptide synthetase, partial [Phycisphaerae bacterium]
DSATFNPTPSLYAQRLSIELLRVTLPLTFFVMLASILISLLVITHGQMSWPAHLLLFPLLYGAAGVVAAGLVIAAKWVLIGRYVPQEKPLWSTFVWRSELLNALHEYLAKPFLIDMFVGTSLLGWFYRLLGMDVGRRVLFDSSEFTEFDLVHLGDDVILNAECTIQTHLFEDRVMKMSTITLEANVSIGANAVVLYDTHLGQDVVLEDLSLVMKGESLPAHTRWQGSPAGHVAV